MSEQNKAQPLAVFHREVFVTNARAGVHIRCQAQGANIVITMAAADAEALAEDLVHAAARARDRDARHAKKGPTC
jgi:hypothetical protein